GPARFGVQRGLAILTAIVNGAHQGVRRVVITIRQLAIRQVASIRLEQPHAGRRLPGDSFQRSQDAWFISSIQDESPDGREIQANSNNVEYEAPPSRSNGKVNNKQEPCQECTYNQNPEQSSGELETKRRMAMYPRCCK